MLTCAKYGMLGRCHHDRRCDTRRRFAVVVWNGVPKPICAKYGILYRHRDARRRCATGLSDGVPMLFLT
jgi:hypothetical protein